MKVHSCRIICSAIILLIALGSGCRRENKVSMFKVDERHSGEYRTHPMVELNSVKWKYRTGGYVFSSPVISGDILYVGSNDSCLYAIDKNTGFLRWKFKSGGEVASTPAVTPKEAFFVSSDGKLYCLNAFSGKNKWIFNGGKEQVFTAPGIHGLQPRDSLMADPWDMYLSSPVIQGNRIFFGSGNGKFYCIDKTNGQELWEFKTNGVIHSSPVVFNNKVYFGGWDTYIHALDINSGSEIWKFKTGEDSLYHNQTGFQSSPVIAYGMLFTGCRDAHLYALDAESGKLIWKKFNHYSWVINTPLVKDSLIYYGTSDTHLLLCLNAFTGDSIKSVSLQAYIFSSPVIAENYLYIGDFSGSVYGIDRSDLVKIWDFRTPASLENKSGLLNADGTVNPGKAGEFFGDAPTYTKMTAFVSALYSEGAVLSTPAVDEGKVYFGSTDSCIYALQ